MKLSDVFNQLSHGELAQLSLGTAEPGVITEASYTKLLPHVNLGLTTLYKRFHLKEGELTLTLQPNQTSYTLHSAFALANTKSRETVRYITDTAAAPFRDDIHKIERIYTDAGLELVLNDRSDRYALHTPTMTSLKVPLAIVNQANDLPPYLKTATLTLAYRANHPQIVLPVGYFNPERVTLELPDSHLEALLLFIASRIHNPVGMTNEFHTGNNYAAKFEAECQRLEDLNLTVDQGAGNDRLARNGWV